jgi:hypothetical protein
MPNLASTLRSEIQRLAKREANSQVAPMRKHRAADRRGIAELKRKVARLERAVAFLEGREKTRLARAPSADEAQGVRFSPKWLASDRKRLGLSAKDYGQLVGVSGLTIYSWESGKSRPRPRQVAAWAKVRGIGKREATRRLALLQG